MKLSDIEAVNAIHSRLEFCTQMLDHLKEGSNRVRVSVDPLQVDGTLHMARDKAPPPYMQPFDTTQLRIGLMEHYAQQIGACHAALKALGVEP